MATEENGISGRAALAICLVAGTLFAAQAMAQTGGATAPSGGAPPTGGGPAAGAVIDGATLFATMCGWCHQDGGRANGRGPKLAGTDKSDEYIISRIKTGKIGAMPAFGQAFSDAQLRAIVTYIRGLKTASP